MNKTSACAFSKQLVVFHDRKWLGPLFPLKHTQCRTLLKYSSAVRCNVTGSSFHETVASVGQMTEQWIYWKALEEDCRPSRYLDFSPVDYFIWSYLKNRAFHDNTQTIEKVKGYQECFVWCGKCYDVDCCTILPICYCKLWRKKINNKIFASIDLYLWKWRLMWKLD